MVSGGWTAPGLYKKSGLAKSSELTAVIVQ
jgi:hypothetical protein